MGTSIKYNGSSDSWTLYAHDLNKAGVEGFKKTTFNKGETVEVESDVAKALVDNESGLFDRFEIVETQEVLEGTDEDTQPIKTKK